MVNTRRVIRTGVAVGLVAASAAGGLGFRHYTASARQVVAAQAHAVSRVIPPSCSLTGQVTLDFKPASTLTVKLPPVFSFNISTLDYGAENATTVLSTGGIGAGKAKFRDITVTKLSDNQDADLLAALGGGVHGTVTIKMYSPAGEHPLCRTITATPTFLTAIAHSSSAGDSTERLTFATGCMVISQDGHSNGWSTILNRPATSVTACTLTPTL